eukprot:6434021-Lingulodinium_polyedra.AAC.1
MHTWNSQVQGTVLVGAEAMVAVCHLHAPSSPNMRNIAKSDNCGVCSVSAPAADEGQQKRPAKSELNSHTTLRPGGSPT